MKYTRYDLRKKKNDNLALMVVLISVLIASYVLGTGLSNLFIKNAKPTNKSDAPGTALPGNNDSGIKVTPENVNVKFVCIQNGNFANKDNAEKQKNQVREVLSPFSIEDEKGTRVLSGIFKEGQAANYIQLLSDKGIPNSKIVFEINKSDICEAEIAEIISGYIDILSELLKKDVKSIQTARFKEYVSVARSANSSSSNMSSLEDLKKHVNALPETMTKDKIEESYTYLYTILKKVAGK